MLIIQIILGFFGVYHLYRIANLHSKNEDLIDSYNKRENPFLTDSNEVIRDYKNSIMWLIFIMISLSLSKLF